MSVRVGKYDFKTRKMPEIPDFSNILIHVRDELSPYILKTEEGCIMENVWQFSKIYRKVYNQNQTIHRYTSEKGWVHPEEIHIDEKGNVLPEYWQWRSKGMNCSHAIRYPNGYNGRSECVGFIWNGQFIPVDKYHIARKIIYYDTYITMCKKNPEYKELQRRLSNKENLQIVEVDGPRKAEDYPFNLAENNSLLINREIAQGWLKSKTQSFGHGVCLAIALLGLDTDDVAWPWGLDELQRRFDASNGESKVFHRQ
jgi:hypothetical protein